LKAIEDSRRREKAYAQAKKQAEKSRKPGESDRFDVNADGSAVKAKELKRKTVPKKKIADEAGGEEWEVVANR